MRSVISLLNDWWWWRRRRRRRCWWWCSLLLRWNDPNTNTEVCHCREVHIFARISYSTPADQIPVWQIGSLMSRGAGPLGHTCTVLSGCHTTYQLIIFRMCWLAIRLVTSPATAKSKCKSKSTILKSKSKSKSTLSGQVQVRVQVHLKWASPSPSPSPLPISQVQVQVQVQYGKNVPGSIFSIPVFQYPIPELILKYSWQVLILASYKPTAR